MPYTPTVFNEGIAPGISAEELNKLGTQYAQAVADAGTAADEKIAIHAALATHLVSGLIIMWYGLIASIPSGWVICDGNNSTPNLLAKFVEGVATAVTNPGAVGGEATHALSEAEMPAHTHPSAASSTPQQSVDRGEGLSSAAMKGSATGSTGSGNAHENKPPFYDIAFLMKT